MKFLPKTRSTIGLIVVGLTVGVFFGVTGHAFACDLPGADKNLFLGFPHWWEYLDGKVVAGSCTPDVVWPGGVWAIGLAILGILLRVAGIVAVISIIVSGVMYVTSAGSPERASSALERIINSLVGLAIVLLAASVVAFIGGRLA